MASKVCLKYALKPKNTFTNDERLYLGWNLMIKIY